MAPFKLLLKNIENQTVPFHEVKVVDFSSHEPYRTDMKELCDSSEVDYILLECNAPDKAIDIFLWNVAVNYGIRQCTGDLVMDSGIDKILETNMVECVLSCYNRIVKTRGRTSLIHSGSYRLNRLPDMEELKDFDSLVKTGRFLRPNAFAYICTSREWWRLVRGYDETVRWYEDCDIARRANQSGLIYINPSFGRHAKTIGVSRSIHILGHDTSRRRYPGKEILNIAKRGKRYLRVKGLPIVRNGEDWGVLTEEKIANAIALVEKDKQGGKKK